MPVKSSKRILVTGATGFLGHTLCPYLVQHGYRLRAFVRPSSAWGFLCPLGVELAWGDIREATAVRAARRSASDSAWSPPKAGRSLTCASR